MGVGHKGPTWRPLDPPMLMQTFKKLVHHRIYVHIEFYGVHFGVSIVAMFVCLFERSVLGF